MDYVSNSLLAIHDVFEWQEYKISWQLSLVFGGVTADNAT
jgi:hypothetical protein